MNVVFSGSGMLYLVLSGLFLTGAFVSFIASAWLTIASHTYVLHSLSGVIIIFYKVIVSMEVHYLEKVGSITVIIGTVFLMLDPNVHKMGNQEASIFGEILAIVWACFFSLYFPWNKFLITKIPGLAILMFNSLISAIWWILIVYFAYGIKIENLFSSHPYEGIFGLFSLEQIKVSLLLGPINMNIAGYTLALNYFQPHIVGNAFVLEPFLGQFLGWITHQDQIPGILTFIGGLIIIPAILVVAKGSNQLAKNK